MNLGLSSIGIVFLLLLLPSVEAADLPNVDLETMRNQLRVAARDLPPLKTEYYESATNGATKINYKLWKTVRAGQLLMTREERDIAGNGTFSSFDYLVYHHGQKVFQFTSVSSVQLSGDACVSSIPRLAREPCNRIPMAMAATTN
jgi:hypothetical protein